MGESKRESGPEYASVHVPVMQSAIDNTSSVAQAQVPWQGCRYAQAATAVTVLPQSLRGAKVLESKMQTTHAF